MSIEPFDPTSGRRNMRSSDSFLLEALTAIIKANVEYNKGVAELLESDSQKRQKLEKLTDDLEDVLLEVKKLSDNHHKLSIQVDEALAFHRNMVNKFKPIYVSMGLKEDGSEHGPTDKLVIKFKHFFFHKISLLLAGALITVLLKFLVKHSSS